MLETLTTAGCSTCTISTESVMKVMMVQGKVYGITGTNTQAHCHCYPLHLHHKHTAYLLYDCHQNAQAVLLQANLRSFNVLNLAVALEMVQSKVYESDGTYTAVHYHCWLLDLHHKHKAYL